LDQQVVTKKRLPETLAEFQLAVILVALWLTFIHFDFF
jgi:hypothetical protein